MLCLLSAGVSAKQFDVLLKVMKQQQQQQENKPKMQPVQDVQILENVPAHEVTCALMCLLKNCQTLFAVRKAKANCVPSSVITEASVSRSSLRFDVTCLCTTAAVTLFAITIHELQL